MHSLHLCLKPKHKHFVLTVISGVASWNGNSSPGLIAIIIVDSNHAT
jgi:hypothetical protein